jgi:alkylation response protein AidB-like acyl-CoA dehydrogenase
MIVMEAIGRGLALEPFLSTVVFGGAALRLGSNKPLMESIAPQIAAGDLILALAYAEPQSRYNLANVKTSARPGKGHYVLEGRKSLVMSGGSADKLIVSARTSGSEADPDGITLFLADAKAPGIEIHDSAGQDGRRVAEIIFSGMSVSEDWVLGLPGQGYALLSELADIAIAALAAEAVGAMERLQALTVDYLKTRKQFGIPIGSFQVLQHKAVDMMIALEQARSMACYGAMMLSAPASERSAALSAVKIQINKSARFLGQQAIQLHSASWRHRHDRRISGEPLFQEADRHRADVRRYGLSYGRPRKSR